MCSPYRLQTPVIHEKRSGGSSWPQVTNLKPSGLKTLPVRIGLKQSNLDRGHDILVDISSLTSEIYGKHFSTDELRAEMHLQQYRFYA